MTKEEIKIFQWRLNATKEEMKVVKAAINKHTKTADVPKNMLTTQERDSIARLYPKAEAVLGDGAVIFRDGTIIQHNIEGRETIPFNTDTFYMVIAIISFFFSKFKNIVKQIFRKEKQ